MSVNTPPTENIPIFDPSVFPSASGTALTIASGSKYFLTYPVAQGSEIFPSNITLQSTLSDASGDVGTSGQILSSTGTGTNWINNSSGINTYTELDTATFPTTLPIPTTANTYVYITGSTGGTITIPTTGVTTGTLINFRNFTLSTINIAGSTYLPYSRFETAVSPYVLSGGCSATFYYNGSIWVQPNVDRTMLNFTVQNTCYAAGLATDSINLAQNHSGTAVNVYNSLTDADLNIANTLPAPYTVRIANTTSGASGGSVHCSNIGFDGSNINNATTPAAGTIKLGNSLTSGPLYIAGGSATPTHTSGPIIIGSDSTATGGINIGTGTDQTVPTVNTVNIGSATYATNIKGTLTSTGTISTTSGSITSAGVITGTSVVSPSFNASSNTDTVGISTTQTSGVLNIGTGARLITGSGGAINIGTGSGAVLNPINIGGAGTITTFANGLSLASSKYITTSHSGTITLPISTQVGGIVSVAYSTPTLPTSGQVITMNTITLDSGTWILTGAVSIGSSANITHGAISFGNLLRTVSTAPVNANDSAYGHTTFNGVTPTTVICPNLTVYVTPTTSTSFYFNITLTFTAGPGFNSAFWKLYAMRIS